MKKLQFHLIKDPMQFEEDMSNKHCWMCVFHGLPLIAAVAVEYTAAELGWVGSLDMISICCVMLEVASTPSCDLRASVIGTGVHSSTKGL